MSIKRRNRFMCKGLRANPLRHPDGAPPVSALNFVLWYLYHDRCERMSSRPNISSKPIRWLGSSLDDLKRFPPEVGFALRAAQTGGKSPAAKPLTGDRAFKGAVALEIVEDHDGNTYRAVYTAKFGEFIFVLHAFQKKSKSGIATPQRDIDLIKRRLALAKEWADAGS